MKKILFLLPFLVVIASCQQDTTTEKDDTKEKTNSKNIETSSTKKHDESLGKLCLCQDCLGLTDQKDDFSI